MVRKDPDIKSHKTVCYMDVSAQEIITSSRFSSNIISL